VTRRPPVLRRAAQAGAGGLQSPGLVPRTVLSSPAVSPSDAGVAASAPGGPRLSTADPFPAPQPCLGRVVGPGGVASGGSRLALPSGRSRSARFSSSGGPARRRASLPGAFGSGQAHCLFSVAASMVCLACSRVFTVGAARGPSEVPCSWVPFLSAPALLLLRLEATARRLGVLPDGPVRRAADRRGLLSRPREPD